MEKAKTKLSIVKIVLVAILLILIVFVALPSYLGNKWTWSDLPQISHINRLKSIELNGLKLPGWQLLKQQRVVIGSHKWSVQLFGKEDIPTVFLFILPQSYYRNHPEIEWVDIDGFERWQKDSQEILEFTTSAGNTIKARFFQARSNQTYAVVQWYAWEGGGDAEVFNWFWRDQLAQIKGNRVPWAAVSIKIMMSPLDELSSQKALAQKLARTVQNSLDSEVFSKLVK